MMNAHKPTARGGYSLLELTFSVAIFVVVLLSSLAMVEHDTQLSQATLSISTVETRAQQMLHELERELANASGDPLAVAKVDTPVDGSEVGSLVVDSTLGFPPSGNLIIDWGGAAEERLSYDSLGTDQQTFLTLDRSGPCSEGSAHGYQAEVLWEGVARPIDDQGSPGANDRQALEITGPMFFQGDGTGFSYRVPVDPAGGNYVLNDDELFWGSPDATPPTEGWRAIVWVPRDLYFETDTADDLNGDGDIEDVFQVGQLRRWTWDVTTGAQIEDLGLGPTAVIQEQCGRGGDLDSDGFDDPIFLWDPDTRRLHIRLTIIGRGIQDMPVLRTVESVVFLRNEPSI